MTKLDKKRQVVGDFESKENDDQTFKDILNGKYDNNGFEVYRIFRNEDKHILKVVFIKDGLFVERNLDQVLTGNCFDPQEPRT